MKVLLVPNKHLNLMMMGKGSCGLDLECKKMIILGGGQFGRV